MALEPQPGAMLRFALLLLLLAPAASALAVQGPAGLEVGIAPTQDGSALPQIGVDAGPVAVSADGLDSVQVSAPLLPALQVTAPGLPVLGVGAPADPAPQPAPKSASHSLPLADVPVPQAAAAGGLLAVGLGLFAWLRLGLAAPFAARLFSRLDKPQVLEHPARARLLDLLASRPGLGTQELRHAAGLAWGTTVHHLRVLERHGLVIALHQGGRRLHFPAGSEAARHRTGIAALLHDTTRRVAEAVRAAPGIAQQDLCASLGLRAPAASKHLARLAQHGLVTVRAEGKSRRYEATHEMARVLLAAA
jgi:DNA-binding transcriptional ArsR family regulator